MTKNNLLYAANLSKTIDALSDFRNILQNYERFEVYVNAEIADSKFTNKELSNSLTQDFIKALSIEIDKLQKEFDAL